MSSIEITNRKRITLFILIFSITQIILAFAIESPAHIFSGEWLILTSPGILITDFIELSNLGAAFFNVGVTTLMGLALAWIVKARFNGFLLSGIFTMAGFSFFGKTPFNILPIFIGVYFYDAFFSHKPLRDLIAPLLFGTTLGPVVSQIAFGFGWGWQGIMFGIILGIVCGALMAAIMGHIYTFHQGYNLYNTGTSAGFIATVVYIMMRGFGLSIKPVFYWSTRYSGFLTNYLLVILFSLIVMGSKK